jgi:hypothetical protein
VNFSIMRWRDETKIIFVTDELSDLRKYFGKILAGYGEVDAASIGLRNGLQLLIGLGQGLVDGLRFLRGSRGFLGTFPFEGLGIAEFAAKRNGQDTHIGRLQAGQQVLDRACG